MRTVVSCALAVSVCVVSSLAGASSPPVRAERGMVVSGRHDASRVGAEVLREGGNAIDAAVATAFTLAVTLPEAGNIGGGGFMVYKPAGDGAPTTYDFREMAPSGAAPDMWLDENGEYDPRKHHEGYLSVGVPGTVAGLHMAWEAHGSLPWARLVQPAIELAENGVAITPDMARAFKAQRRRFENYPSSMAVFTKDGQAYEAGDLWRQPSLAETLRRIAEQGPKGFYEGETADLLVSAMEANGGLITREDLKAYRAVERAPIVGAYRGHTVIGMGPPSSGGVAVVMMLNILEGFDLTRPGFGSSRMVHLYAEVMRRAFADRARYLGDPDFNPTMPIERLTSKAYAEELRRTINPARASSSSPESFEWPVASDQTTHFSVIDKDGAAVALTYTLEYSYGSAIVVDGAGFLLNNEMGDFNPKPGWTSGRGHIGTPPNTTEPGKRMLSSMSPTIVLDEDGAVKMVTGSPGGRTIINTVLQTIVNVIDFGMDAQEAVDAPRVHHQWLPDEVRFEPFRFAPEVRAILRGMGHSVSVRGAPWGSAQVIVVGEDGALYGGSDTRRADGGAVGY